MNKEKTLKVTNRAIKHAIKHFYYVLTLFIMKLHKTNAGEAD